MENRVEWHGKAPKKEETEKALKELNAAVSLRGEAEAISEK